MLRLSDPRNLVLSVAAAALVLAGGPASLAQSQRPPAPQPSARESEPAPPRPANRLERLAANAAEAMAKYRATLEPVLAIYERELTRHTELAELRQDLYERGALSAHDLEQGRRALAAAQQNVDDTRRAMAEADRMLTEARVAGTLARLRPLERGGYEETAGLVRYNGAANWALADDTPKVQRFFAALFGRALPISAFGQTALHRRMGFDHHNALDVAVHPDSPEGRALMDYLRKNGIPFIAAWGEIPGSTSGAHIHVGQPSPRLFGRK
ncbi:MAG TPA: hypothetical protein VGR44_02075 [Methylomirabilota bacterium]|jgi:hypothetical protein|nr:hypothetical protein [Methylomirabilota bacterium]